jgi:hypothetical protein
MLKLQDMLKTGSPCLPQLSASGYGKVDFEGYINDAGAEYKIHKLPRVER